MLCFPRAKINIGLNITERRRDGYHNIESIFYPVDYYDTLEILPSKKLNFKNYGLKVPSKPEQNLSVKAFKLIQQEYKIPDIEMILLKNIPISSGLGGGSSDATAALKLLDTIFDLKISHQKLTSFAARLGSDCPFFVINQPMFVFGTGDKFEATDLDLTNYHVLIVSPKIEISTEEAYKNCTPELPKRRLKDLINLPISIWKNSIKNDFEEFVFHRHPDILELKNKLYDLDALYASLSGSGSSVYGLFKNNVTFKDELFRNCRIWQGVLK